MQLRVLGLGVASLAAFVLAAVSTASATGTARVQQRNGTVNNYTVSIAYEHHTIRVTNASKHDTLIFEHAACSFAGQLQRCLPYAIHLDRDGKIHTIALSHGTVYMNLTDDRQQLPLSSKSLPPDGVILEVQTARGTFITVRGLLDVVKP